MSIDECVVMKTKARRIEICLCVCVCVVFLPPCIESSRAAHACSRLARPPTLDPGQEALANMGATGVPNASGLPIKAWSDAHEDVTPRGGGADISSEVLAAAVSLVASQRPRTRLPESVVVRRL